MLINLYILNFFKVDENLSKKETRKNTSLIHQKLSFKRRIKAIASLKIILFSIPWISTIWSYNSISRTFLIEQKKYQLSKKKYFSLKILEILLTSQTDRACPTGTVSTSWWWPCPRWATGTSTALLPWVGAFKSCFSLSDW